MRQRTHVRDLRKRETEKNIRLSDADPSLRLRSAFLRAIMNTGNFSDCICLSDGHIIIQIRHRSLLSSGGFERRRRMRRQPPQSAAKRRATRRRILLFWIAVLLFDVISRFADAPRRASNSDLIHHDVIVHRQERCGQTVPRACRMESPDHHRSL